jgi:hypothetical protein
VPNNGSLIVFNRLRKLRHYEDLLAWYRDYPSLEISEDF